ncbi:sulfur carrier protein ThiS [Pseudoflavonifractor sp. An85]|uniref:sulfur carrier protein ThiS n=1 Tax=Pseudoflavonifractor sp. An85 TaxID=1965661 RepID=UPI000B38C50D|nr:sulfur carrier protein ThiS [Pseudoflavonifractor sp. An85]OUN21440.1 thiamine biosynthesis protein ThiS [Pseudoflavonifractor sp. An85]
MLKINGQPVPATGETLLHYLTACNYDLQRLAVERNGEIVPKHSYGTTVLCDGDQVEIVSFVGGG